MRNWRQNGLWKVGTLIWASLSLCLTAIATLLATPFLGGKRAFFTVGPWWLRQLFPICGIQWSVRGWEELPEEIRNGTQPVIFMSNHESHLDPPFLVGAIPIPTVFIAKKEIKWMPLVGWVAWAAGTIFIDRGHRDVRHSIRQAAQEIRNGKSVLIFPEGTRTRTGKLGSFKKGGFNLAMTAEVPLVPLATVGGFKILPAGRMTIAPGRFDVIFGQPLHPGDFTNREDLLQATQDSIAALKEKVSCP